MAEIQDLTRGMPVEVAQINRSLKAALGAGGERLDEGFVDQFRRIQRSRGCAQRKYAAHGTDNA